MPQLPEKLPEGGRIWWTRLARAFNDLRDYVDSLKPIESVNEEIDWSSLGVSIKPKSKDGATPEPVTGMVYKGAWSSLVSYKKNDVVFIPSSVPGNAIGPEPGLYICLADAPAGTAEPQNYDISGATPFLSYWQLLAPASWAGMTFQDDDGNQSTIGPTGVNIGQTAGVLQGQIAILTSGDRTLEIDIQKNGLADTRLPDSAHFSLQEIKFQFGGNVYRTYALCTGMEYVEPV